ncbi:hypothetical protein CHUAL_009386 [Chamberlinius hualienensis]
MLKLQNYQTTDYNKMLVKTPIKDSKLIKTDFNPPKTIGKVSVKRLKTVSPLNTLGNVLQNEAISRNSVREIAITNNNSSSRKFQPNKMINHNESMSNDQKNWNEMEIKASNIKSKEKNDYIANVRDTVLAKFNNWVIDLDWNENDELGTETTAVVSPTIKSSLFGLDEKSEIPVSNGIVTLKNNDFSTAKIYSEADQDNRSNHSSSGFIKDWKFKSNSIGTSKKCEESGSNIMEMFLNLRNKSNLKCKSPAKASVVSNKRRKTSSVNDKTENEYVSECASYSEIQNNNSRTSSAISSTFHGDAIATNIVTSSIKPDAKITNSQLPNYYQPVKIICSSDVAENSEFMNLLEIRYNLSFVIRGSDVNNAEMCIMPDFIIDETTAILLNSFSSLVDVQEFLKLRKKLFSLTIRHSVCWILLVNSKTEPCLKPEMLLVFSKLSVFSQQLNMSLNDFKSKLLICKDMDQAANYIRRIVDLSVQSSKQWDDGSTCLTSREWLLPNPTAHEEFLCKFPSISAFNAQIMLGSAPLRCLLQISLEELKQKLPLLPVRFLECFYKLAHRSLSESPIKKSLNFGDAKLSSKPVTTALLLIEQNRTTHSVSSVMPTVANHGAANFKEFRFNPVSTPNTYRNLSMLSTSPIMTAVETRCDQIDPYTDINDLSKCPELDHFSPTLNTNTYDHQLPASSTNVQQTPSFKRNFHFKFMPRNLFH